MTDVEKAIDRIEKSMSRNQHETRENIDKLFIYLARLEVAIGKLTVQLETEKERHGETKDGIDMLRGRIRRVELVFAPVTIALGGVMAYIIKKFGF